MTTATAQTLLGISKGTLPWRDSNMRYKHYLTELKLNWPLSSAAIIWLAASIVFAALYTYRAISELIPPEEHMIFSLVLCVLLTQVWMNLEQISLTMRLHENRCWLRHYRLGTKRETSIPVSQIHSARLEYDAHGDRQSANTARIILITTLGVIPVSDGFHKNAPYLDRACHRINEFLESQTHFLNA